MDIGVGRPDMKSFGDEWVVKIATLYGWNAERSRHWISGASEQTAAFDETQRELESGIGKFFDDARRQLDDLPEEAPQRKPLQSLLRQGLEVFVHNPAVPMDNNLAERALRGPAVGRKLSFGSRGGSATGRTTLLRARSNWPASRRATGSEIICKPAPNMADGRPKRRMPGFPGAPTRSASAPGATSFRKDREFCGRKFSEADINLIRDRATEPASQTHAPVARANASIGASPTAASKT